MIKIKSEYPFTVVGSSFIEIFYEYLDKIMNRPEFKMNPRGTKTRGITGSTMILTNPRNRIAYVSGRKYKLSYGLAEFLWYMSGSNSLDMITNYAPSMKKYSDDDKTVRSGYGKKMFRNLFNIGGCSDNYFYKVSQMQYIIEKIKRDKNTRQAVIMIRDFTDSAHDINYNFKSKDIPCTLYLHFQIISNKLQLTVAMRSQDLLIGKLYDVFTFTMIQEWVYLKLLKYYPDLRLGNYIMHDDNVHIYSNWYEKARKYLKNKKNVKSIPMDIMNDVDLNKILEIEKRMREKDGFPLTLNQDISKYWYDILYILQYDLSNMKNGDKSVMEKYINLHKSLWKSIKLYEEDRKNK